MHSVTVAGYWLLAIAYTVPSCQTVNMSIVHVYFRQLDTRHSLECWLTHDIRQYNKIHNNSINFECINLYSIPIKYTRWHASAKPESFRCLRNTNDNKLYHCEAHYDQWRTNENTITNFRCLHFWHKHFLGAAQSLNRLSPIRPYTFNVRFSRYRCTNETVPRFILPRYRFRCCCCYCCFYSMVNIVGYFLFVSRNCVESPTHSVYEFMDPVRLRYSSKTTLNVVLSLTFSL